MCRDAVAAPRALQLIVYPISLKKSLLFCEKIEKIELFFRKEIKSENSAGTKAFKQTPKYRCAGRRAGSKLHHYR